MDAWSFVSSGRMMGEMLLFVRASYNAYTKNIPRSLMIHII